MQRAFIIEHSVFHKILNLHYFLSPLFSGTKQVPAFDFQMTI